MMAGYAFNLSKTEEYYPHTSSPAESPEKIPALMDKTLYFTPREPSEEYYTPPTSVVAGYEKATQPGQPADWDAHTYTPRGQTYYGRNRERGGRGQGRGKG